MPEEKKWNEALLRIASEKLENNDLTIEELFWLVQHEADGFQSTPSTSPTQPPTDPPPPVEPTIYIYGVHDAPPGYVYVQMYIENLALGMVTGYNAQSIPTYGKYQSRYKAGKIIWKALRWKLVVADSRGKPKIINFDGAGTDAVEIAPHIEIDGVVIYSGVNQTYFKTPDKRLFAKLSKLDPRYS